jgi:ABC-type taurine transport system ATPase subunit
MKVGLLRERLSAALDAAMRNREPTAIALTADRTKAMAVAISNMAEDAEIEVDALSLSTRDAAIVLGYHPEHVRRLIRGGRLRAMRRGVDYEVALTDLWPLLEARHQPPGRRRPRRR